MNPFDFIESISFSKKDLLEADPACVKDYVPYMVNRGLSFHADTILYANDMNQLHDLEKDQQYKYLLEVVRPRKRFSGKWPKKVTNENVEMIMEFYRCNRVRAMEALSLMTEKQIGEMKIMCGKGGDGK